MGNRFPFQKQYDAAGCGGACVKMVCDYFHAGASYLEINRMLSATTEGVSMLAIERVLHELGIDSQAAFMPVEALYQIELPVILHWNQNHFVVLYKVDGGGRRFWVSDPAKGRYSLGKEDFESHWATSVRNGCRQGVALLLEPDEERMGQRAGEKPECGHSLRFLWGYILKYRSHFLLIGLSLLLGCALQLVMPFLTQWIVDIGISHRDIKLIWLILLGEMMIVVGRTATDFVRRWLLLHISMRVNISLVSDFFVKLLRLPMQFFDNKKMGDLLQRMQDHTRVQQFLTGQALNLMFTLLSFLVFGIVLLVYSRLIFAVFLAGSVVYGLWIARFLARRKVLDYELFEQQAKNHNRTFQFVTSMQEIKLQGCEQRRRWEWEDTQAGLYDVQMKSLKLQQAQEAGSVFINETKNILITVLAATAVIDGQITLGAMLAVQYIVGQLNSPVEQLMQFVYSLQDVKISLERINEIHQGKDEECEKGLATEFAGEMGIKMKHVDFRYDPYAAKKTLDDVSVAIPAGKVTAIVGASGSGKTTMVKLMLGYYKPEAGEIDIAGRNIEGYSLKWWRSRCGAVMQDGVIFSESIARNIAVGDGPIDAERLEMAARIACIHGYVMGLPLRYNTQIGRDGMGLSQGQKQRILIARAVYKNPDYIFLDEATNALDAKNERDIVENLAEFCQGRTVVVVAHRLSTVKDADQIIVVDGGRVAEVGDHASLTALQGAYYNLVKNQLELGN